MRRVRLDWVTTVSRQAVDVANLDSAEVFHYSIPVIEATGDGAVERTEHIDSSKLLLEGGEVLISKLNPRKARVLIAQAHEIPTVCSGEFIPLVPQPDIDRQFLWWRLSSNDVTQELGSQVRSVTRSHQRIDPIVLTKLWFDLPSLDEQKRISAFLDSKCADIDELLQEMATQRALLDERRSALITMSLSGVFSGNHDLVESGIPWIGHIPSHWEVMRLKHLGRASIGLTYSPTDVVEDPSEGTLVLRSGNIQNGRISLEDNVFVRTPVPSHLRTLEGDILICVRNGSVRLIGKSAVITDEMAGVTWGAFMSVFRSPMNQYLSWVLRSSIFSQQLGLFATSTINQLTNATLHNFQVPVPPEDERRSLVRALEDECGRIDDLEAELERSTALLNERKTAIITTAVTGQMEVA